MISVDLAKKLAKYIPWEPKVGDLTIVFGEAGEEIIEPINLKHEKEKKILLSLRNVGHIVWLPRLTMLLYELKKRSETGFSLTYDRETDSWCYRDERMEICNSSPEDAAARALLRLLEEEERSVVPAPFSSTQGYMAVLSCSLFDSVALDRGLDCSHPRVDHQPSGILPKCWACYCFSPGVTFNSTQAP